MTNAILLVMIIRATKNSRLVTKRNLTINIALSESDRLHTQNPKESS